LPFRPAVASQRPPPHAVNPAVPVFCIGTRQKQSGPFLCRRGARWQTRESETLVCPLYSIAQLFHVMRRSALREDSARFSNGVPVVIRRYYSVATVGSELKIRIVCAVLQRGRRGHAHRMTASVEQSEWDAWSWPEPGQHQLIRGTFYRRGAMSAPRAACSGDPVSCVHEKKRVAHSPDHCRRT